MKINWHIEKWTISDLKEWAKNPRLLTKQGMKDLARSIDSFGLAEPVVINTEGTIIGGHVRVAILKQRNETECDCYVPDRTLTEKEVEELCLRLNANTAGTWDILRLKNEWELPELIDWGLNLPEFELYNPENKEKEVDENLKTENKCPSCGYVW